MLPQPTAEGSEEIFSRNVSAGKSNLNSSTDTTRGTKRHPDTDILTHTALFSPHVSLHYSHSPHEETELEKS